MNLQLLCLSLITIINRPHRQSTPSVLLSQSGSWMSLSSLLPQNHNLTLAFLAARTQLLTGLQAHLALLQAHLAFLAARTQRLTERPALPVFPAARTHLQSNQLSAAGAPVRAHLQQQPHRSLSPAASQAWDKGLLSLNHSHSLTVTLSGCSHRLLSNMPSVKRGSRISSHQTVAGS